MKSNFTAKELAAIAGALLGACAIELGLACLRAWLLSVVVALFVPTIALGFWEWVLVVTTVRFIFAGLNSSTK